MLILKLFKKKQQLKKIDDVFKNRIIEGLKEFEEDKDMLLLIANNIYKYDDIKELETYLYYTLRELYLIDISNPLCYLLGCDSNIKTLTYWEMLNGVTRLNY